MHKPSIRKYVICKLQSLHAASKKKALRVKRAMRLEAQTTVAGRCVVFWLCQTFASQTPKAVEFAKQHATKSLFPNISSLSS